MRSQNWKQSVFTIPNLLSLLRLALIPVYLTIYGNASKTEDYILAGIILILSCVTDALDGFIARKYHMISSVGKILDPIADKATQISLALCLSSRYPVLISVAVLLLIKETLQLIGTFVLLRKGDPIPSAMMAGKVSTFVLFTSLIFLFLFPYSSAHTVNTIAVLDFVFLLYALTVYYTTFWRKPPIGT